MSRYTSRRNPYCRTICHELRLSMEALAYNPRCPTWARTIIYKVSLCLFKETKDIIDI